jgi:hypothetical protein
MRRKRCCSTPTENVTIAESDRIGQEINHLQTALEFTNKSRIVYVTDKLRGLSKWQSIRVEPRVTSSLIWIG